MGFPFPNRAIKERQQEAYDREIKEEELKKMKVKSVDGNKEIPLKPIFSGDGDMLKGEECNKRHKFKPQPCSECHKEFNPNSGRQLTCSKKCAAAREKRINTEREEKRTKKEPKFSVENYDVKVPEGATVINIKPKPEKVKKIPTYIVVEEKKGLNILYDIPIELVETMSAEGLKAWIVKTLKEKKTETKKNEKVL